MNNHPYLRKFKGQGNYPPKKLSFAEILLSACGCFAVIFIISVLDKLSHQFFLEQPLFVAPVGASAIMIFGLPESDYAQPRNVIGGHFFSALCGVTAFYFFPLLLPEHWPLPLQWLPCMPREQFIPREVPQLCSRL